MVYLQTTIRDTKKTTKKTKTTTTTNNEKWQSKDSPPFQSFVQVVECCKSYRITSVNIMKDALPLSLPLFKQQQRMFICLEDVGYVQETFEKGERPDIKMFYLRDPFQLARDAERRDVAWTLARLLCIGRIITCDERSLWEHLSPDLYARFEHVEDLWIEQKAVKWVRSFLVHRSLSCPANPSGEGNACRLSPLWKELVDHMRRTIKPAANTPSVSPTACSTASPSQRLPYHVPPAVQVIPMRGLTEGCIRCREPLAAFSEVLRVPRDALFYRDSVLMHSRLGQAVAATPGLCDILEHEEALLVLCLVYERFVVGAEASHWGPLLRGCPESYPLIPSFWDMSDLAELEGLDMLDEILERRRELEAFHERVLSALPVIHSALQLTRTSKRDRRDESLETLETAFSLEALQWARASFDSRAFYLNVDSETRLTMAPLADMINHANTSDVLVRRVATDAGPFIMETGAGLGKEDVGRELWMSYGPLQNWELLQYYGFVLDDNAHDKLPFPFQLGSSAGGTSDETEDTEVVAGATNAEWEARRRDLAERFFLHTLDRCWIPMTGVPCPALLALLRLQFATAPEMLEMLDGRQSPFSPLSVETEVTVYRAVAATVRCVLGLFSTSVTEDEAALREACQEETEEADAAVRDVQETIAMERYKLCLRLRIGLKGIAGRALAWASEQLAAAGADEDEEMTGDDNEEQDKMYFVACIASTAVEAVKLKLCHHFCSSAPQVFLLNRCGRQLGGSSHGGKIRRRRAHTPTRSSSIGHILYFRRKKTMGGTKAALTPVTERAPLQPIMTDAPRERAGEEEEDADADADVSSPVLNRVLSVVATPDITIERVLQCCPNLSIVTEVDLSGNFMCGDLFIQLVDRLFPEMTRLSTLDLKCNRIGPAGAKHLFDALRVHSRRLRYLDVSENDLGDAAMPSLAQLLSVAELETLSLTNNNVTPAGALELSKGIEENNSLTELAMSYNALEDTGVVELAEAVAQHCSLTLLDLSGNRIGDPGAIFLAHELLSAESQLKYLNLSANDIGDEGLGAISEALCETSSIVRLDLGGNNRITEAGRRDFTKSAAKWRSIEYLDLTSSNLDEQDGVSLAKAIKTSKCSLREVVVLKNTMLPANAIQAIQQATERKEFPAADGINQPLPMSPAACAGMGLTLLLFTGVLMTVLHRRSDAPRLAH
eukprot:gene11593-7988_t